MVVSELHSCWECFLFFRVIPVRLPPQHFIIWGSLFWPLLKTQGRLLYLPLASDPLVTTFLSSPGHRGAMLLCCWNLRVWGTLWFQLLPSHYYPIFFFQKFFLFSACTFLYSKNCMFSFFLWRVLYMAYKYLSTFLSAILRVTSASLGHSTIFALPLATSRLRIASPWEQITMTLAPK